MAQATKISTEETDHFRERLREIRDRLIHQVDSGLDEIRDELNPAGNLSNFPMHLGDNAPSQIDADIAVMENERSLLQQVQNALHRIDAGTFGRCDDCNSPIPAARLQQIPYTSYCIKCTDKHPREQGPQSSRGTGSIRLTGFAAIEFADQEGLTLNKMADSIDDAAEDLSIAEAEAIAADRPELIWIRVASDDYGTRKNRESERGS